MMQHRRFIGSNLSALALASWLLTGCGNDASLGNDQGHLDSGHTGGSSSAEGGGSNASGGLGGNGSGGASPVTGGNGSGGASPVTGGNGSGGASPVTGGNGSGGAPATGGKASGGSPTTGGKTSGGSPATGGKASGGASSGGTASGGTATGGKGGNGSLNPADSLTDPNTTGSAECASTTLAELIDAVHQSTPELADVMTLYQPNSIDQPQVVLAFHYGNGFRLVFSRGSGDCPAGCIDREYWYFETDSECAPVAVGHFARVFNSTGNCYALTGTPLWNLPPQIPATQCP